MISEALKPNVQDLQIDVIDLLGQISSLMYRASTELSSDSAGKKYATFQQEVAEAARNVEKLELMMAIVAPMNAGKSTIINAIVGQGILPSRAAAMTTLPTKIVFNAELTEPTLTLSAEILSVFQETLLALRRKIQALGRERMQEKIAQYPHLMNLLQEIQDTVGFPTRAKTSGREEIIKALTGLNDIIRLCSLLEPSKDPLGYVQLYCYPVVFGSREIQVRDSLTTHMEHIQYRYFKEIGLPIGSGMVESACKWLIQQRFKGVGMRWSEDGFNHLLNLRLAWVNQRFDALFSDESLTLSLYSPNR